MTGYRLHGRDRLQDAILALPERSVMNVYSGLALLQLPSRCPCSRATRPARRWVDQVRVIVCGGLLLELLLGVAWEVAPACRAWR